MAKELKNICGVILAGGKCSRYEGKNKAFLEIENETFYNKSIRVLKNVFDEIIVITNHLENFPKDKITKYQDIIKDIGPLGGIHAALYNVKGFDAIFIVAVDMPFIDENIINKMITYFNEHDADVLIPIIGKNIEPLFSIYSMDILKKLDVYLETTRNFSIRSFLKIVKTKYFELESTFDNKKAFFNINSQTDYDAHIK